MTRGSGARGILVIVAILAACGASLWYVVAPPKGPDAYRERLAASTETLLSQVQTTRIWAQTFEDENALRSTALVAFKEAESDASAAASQFESYEPPSGLLDLRDRYAREASKTTSALAEFRIAAEQERWGDIAGLAEDLSPLIESLEELEREAKP